MKTVKKGLKKAVKTKAKPPRKKSIFRKILKIWAIAAAFVFVLVVGASIAVYVIVDKDFVQAQLENALHRQVRIGEVNTSVFSAVSGIEVNDVKVSNFKTAEQLKNLSGKPVSDSDLFASLKSFKFKLSIPPLLKKKFVLNEIMLYSPRINVVRYKSGKFNFSDLLIPSKKDVNTKDTAKKVSPEESKSESAPVKIDDIPVAVNIGSVGMQDSEVMFYDELSGQKLSIYKLTAKVYDIEIDSADINRKDNIKLKISFGIKTVSRPKSGSVESFDVGFDVNGNIIPFDKSTRIMNPEVSVKAGSPYGTVTGLQIFNEMINVEQLAKYSGKFDFLKKEINWKNGYVGIHYKNNIVTLSDGKIKTDDYSLLFGGSLNTVSSVINFTADLAIAEKHADKVREKVKNLVSKAVKGKIAKYIKPEKIAEAAVKPLLNDKGEIALKEKITGTLSKPKGELVSPKLGSLDDMIKNAVKEAGEAAIDEAKEKVKDKAKDAVDKQTDKAKDKAASKLKGLLKNR